MSQNKTLQDVSLDVTSTASKFKKSGNHKQQHRSRTVAEKHVHEIAKKDLNIRRSCKLKQQVQPRHDLLLYRKWKWLLAAALLGRFASVPHQHRTKMIWHLRCWPGCHKLWNGVIMAADKTGIPPHLLLQGHHDDSSVWSTLRWRRLRECSALGCFRQTVTGRRWWQTLFSSVLSLSLSPRPSFLPPSLSPRPSPPAPLPPCLRISPETNADQYLFPWIPGGCCKDCCKAFSLAPLCLETMVLRPTPPSSSLLLHATRLSRVSWQMLSEACTYTQNTLCPHLLGLLGFTLVRV